MKKTVIFLHGTFSAKDVETVRTAANSPEYEKINIVFQQGSNINVLESHEFAIYRMFPESLGLTLEEVLEEICDIKSKDTYICL